MTKVEKVERERLKLYDLAMRYGMQHPKFLAQNAKVDKLVNDVMRERLRKAVV